MDAYKRVPNVTSKWRPDINHKRSALQECRNTHRHQQTTRHLIRSTFTNQWLPNRRGSTAEFMRENRNYCVRIQNNHMFNLLLNWLCERSTIRWENASALHSYKLCSPARRSIIPSLKLRNIIAAERGARFSMGTRAAGTKQKQRPSEKTTEKKRHKHHGLLLPGRSFNLPQGQVFVCQHLALLPPQLRVFPPLLPRPLEAEIPVEGTLVHNVRHQVISGQRHESHSAIAGREQKASGVASRVGIAAGFDASLEPRVGRNGDRATSHVVI